MRTALLFVHGYAHYCAPSYDWLATMLAPRGVACFALEHVGHGKSEGLRAYIPSFDGLVNPDNFVPFSFELLRGLADRGLLQGMHERGVRRLLANIRLHPVFPSL